jgi:hypothetical protein
MIDEPLSNDDSEFQSRTTDRVDDLSEEDRGPERCYAPATSRDCRQQLHELFPARYLTIALLLLLGLALVAVLELGHVWAGSLAALLDAEDVSSLDLSAAASLSRWFAAMLLGIGSLVAMFIYSLRRRRLDDYHGRYRVWIWTTLGCLLASAAETTSVDSLGRGLCRRAAEICGLDNSIVWPALVAAILAALGIRLKIEVRRCRAAVVALGAATIGFLVAVTVEYGWIVEVSDHARPLVLRGSWLSGYVLMLAAFLLYARHVKREIEGLVAVRTPKTRHAKAKHLRTDLAETTPSGPHHHSELRTDLDSIAAPTGRSHDGHVGSRASSDVSDGSESNEGRHDRSLSRAERRRLRREARNSR